MQYWKMSIPLKLKCAVQPHVSLQGCGGWPLSCHGNVFIILLCVDGARSVNRIVLVMQRRRFRLMLL